MTRQSTISQNFRFVDGLLLVIILLGFAVRLFRLGVQSLWYDETVSAFLASLPPPELVAHTSRDIHPPGYYLLLHYWATMFGQSEFALALFSVFFGVLLIPLTYLLAAYLANRSVALWAALLVAISPFNLWYSQEVRMYTLGAAMGVLAVYFALRAFSTRSVTLRWKFWISYAVVAAVGLYTLYYFAFLLVAINLLLLMGAILPRYQPATLKSIILANAVVLVLYIPWLPAAWRQAANPPVPPWRSPPRLWAVAVESWTALSLGQSVEGAVVWPFLLLTLVLFILGIGYLSTAGTKKQADGSISPAVLLVVYTFVPLLTIFFISYLTPLYHVRYLFTYAPAFYILLAGGLVWLTIRRQFVVPVVLIGLLGAASAYSIIQFHFNPRFRADDYRAAVGFIQAQWRPGDIILANAGYTYPAFHYYADQLDIVRERLVPYTPQANDITQPRLFQTGTIDGSPQLGWGDPRSDFYATTEAETMTSLEQLSRDFSRLWVLRAYDTVTDPDGLIRDWLAENAVPIEDQLFAGTSNVRAQGFLLNDRIDAADQSIPFEDGMVLKSWQVLDDVSQAGQTIQVRLWWAITAPPRADYKMSLKLWTSAGQLAAQGQDEWPGGTLYRTTAWPPGDVVYHPGKVDLPADMEPGQYWLNVELYHPDTVQPLPRADNSETAVTLGPITIEPSQIEIQKSTSQYDAD